MGLHDASDESGYASGGSSSDLASTTASVAPASPQLLFTKSHLDFLNRQLADLEPQEILKWAVVSLPSLFQTSALGLTGLVTLDMLSRLDGPHRARRVDLIFFDTLYHFPETLALLERVRARYPGLRVHVYRPQASDGADLASARAFEQAHGERLWETDDQRYDFLAKVEPAQRAYRELGAGAVLTGRRRSQGAKRGQLGVLEMDEAGGGAGPLKVNPLLNWSFEQVLEYIRAHDLPYNPLLDRGYKSVGDWHSTQPTNPGDDERSGRWSGQQKTECGIHNPRSKYAKYLRDMQMNKQVASGA